MAKRNRKFLTGSQRAEYEHIYGPLPVDEQDTRFVLVTDEELDRILALPAGVPVRPLTQNQDEVAKIAAHFEAAAKDGGVDVGDGAESYNPTAFNVKADTDALSVGGVDTGNKTDKASWGTGADASPEEPVGKTPAPSGAAGGDSTKKR